MKKSINLDELEFLTVLEKESGEKIIEATPAPEPEATPAPEPEATPAPEPAPEPPAPPVKLFEVPTPAPAATIDPSKNDSKPPNDDANEKVIETPAEEKRGRGRPRKSEAAKESFDNYKKTITPAPATTPATATTPAKPAPPVTYDMSKHITGYMLLVVMDIFFPVLLTKVVGMFNPRAKEIDRSKMKLTSEEKKELNDLADVVAKMMFATMHPLTAFGLITGMMYYAKFDEQLSALPPLKPESK